MDQFDLDDAFGKQKEYMCSADLREFIKENQLDLNQNGVFNPRDVFGSRTDMDHLYNTPRAWFMGRYLAPYSHTWDGDGAEFGPESDNIPLALVPDRKVTLEDVKYLLSSHFQGTPYDPYLSGDKEKRGIYRTIGINRTGVTAICQIRSHVPQKIRGLEWISFGSTTFDAMLPVYTNVDQLPAYLSKVTTEPSTENFYWSSRLLNALADPHYGACVQDIGRYQSAVFTEGRRILRVYDQLMAQTGDFSLMKEANKVICQMGKEKTISTLGKILLTATERMQNRYNLADK